MTGLRFFCTCNQSILHDPYFLKVIPSSHKSENRKTKTKNTAHDQPTFLLDTMKLSNTFAATLMAVLISPTLTSATDELTGKNKMGKLTETYTTVFIATNNTDLEVSDDRDSLLKLAFLEDDLVYAYKKVQEGMELQKKGSSLDLINVHFIGRAEDPDGDVLFPELSKSLRGSTVGWGYVA
jgi:hypothetical protein